MALRAVAEGETGKAEKVLSVTEAAARGSLRQQLVAMRTRVAATVEDPTCPARDLSSLTRRLMEITKEIDAIDVREREADEDSDATPDEDWQAV